MISQQKTRVQAIKSKFENLNVEQPLIIKKNYHQLNKHDQNECTTEAECNTNCDKENSNTFNHVFEENVTDASSGQIPQPNPSYLYNKNDVKRTLSETKKALTRQTSDPGKKLHRSHAFRCDRSQKIVSPQRHGSCNGRSETSDFSLKMGDKKLSKDRLKRLGNLLEDQMRKENFVPLKNNEVIVGEVRDVTNSIPDSDVPQHILDQYAKVIKPKKKDEKQDAMTDSGVSSETENLDDEKTGRIKKLMTQFEKSDEIELKNPLANLAVNDLCISSETIKLERKNPHLTLTDTLKKALKQPLPPGPPPKKPPRVFASSPISESPEKQKKDTKKMLEKLEQVLQKREAQKTEYDIAETNSTIKKPKEIHYLCTEILDITQRTLLLNQNIGNCFKSLNCAIVPNHSTLSLPYTRLSTGSNISSLKNSCSCSNEGLDNESKRISSFLAENKCSKCQENTEKLGFQCHLNCKCKKSKFFVDEHIYDVPFEVCDGASKGRSKYGTLNHSKSLEDLRTSEILSEDQKIYDIPCDISRPETPVAPESRSSSPKSPQTPDTPEMLPSSPKSLPKSDFEKLRRNFENGFKDDIKSVPEEDTETRIDTKKMYTEKPPMKPKPIFVKKVSKSTENLTDDTKIKNGEKKFGTDTKRYRKVKSDITSGIRLSLAKRNSTQLDVDRENLNRLMNEIYETVTAACNMEDNKPASFPTDQSDGSEDSVKLTRSLTEKRKNYVRRVSSRVAYLDPKNIKTSRFRHQTSICSYKSEILDNPYSTFRSWKCFRASQNNLTRDKMDLNQTDLSMATDLDSTDSIDNQSIDEKTGCVDIELPFVPREKGLFNVCLLVGLNYMTGQAYVKNVFPSQVQVPPHIENLIFPETLSSASKGEWSAEAKGAQCYSLVLTDERGERAYGYCRRVLPEGATTCLPLCYCLIGKYRAPGFYYKVLQEIESRHGSSDVEIHSILQQLFETDFPNPGEDITITYSNKLTENSISDKCKTMPDMRRSVSHNSGVFDKSGVCDRSGVDRSGVSDKSGVDRSGVSDKSGVTDSDRCTDRVSEFYDVENNNSVRKVSLSLEGPRIKSLRRPIEPRVDEHNLSVLLDCLGAGLTIKVFGSLLLERKVLLLGDKLSLVSSCMEALQAVLYPFVWQQPLISTIPSEIQRDVLEAPLPILAGMLKTGDFDSSGVVFEEGMLIDLTSPSKVIFYQGDESTILPTSSYKTLKTSLQMEAKQRQDDAKTRNLMISEAFLRFFVDILGDFWKYFSLGELKEGGFGKGDVVFDKESFIKNTSTKQNQYCLEWFTETAMFNHFIQNMAVTHKRGNLPKEAQSPHTMELVDTPLPDFYDLFEERVRSRKANGNQKCVESKSNYKNAMNKKVRLLKTKLRELVA